MCVFGVYSHGHVRHESSFILTQMRQQQLLQSCPPGAQGAAVGCAGRVLGPVWDSSPPPAGCSSSSALRVFFSVFLAVLSGFYSHRNFRVNVPNFVEEKNLVGVSIGTVLTL